MLTTMADLLETIGKQRTKEAKIQKLKENDSLALRVILQAAYDPAVEFQLPPEEPPYTPNEMTDVEHIFYKEAANVRYYVKGFYPELSSLKRETMYIQFLERLHKKDAEMLVNAILKKPFKGITKEVVQEALPGIFGK